MRSNMTDADYESIKNKYKEFIEYNKPKLLEFLQNVPYEEFTATLKNKLGVENLHIKYEIKEKQSSNSFSCYYVYYTSNDLTEESKLLSAVYREYILQTFGYETACAYLQDGRKFSNEIFNEEFDTFDINQRIRFKLNMGIDARYKHRGGGENGCGFGRASYTENDGWVFDWLK